MAFETHDFCRPQQVGIVRRAMDVVTTEAGDSSSVHHARDEVVALHSILVRRSVRKMSERGFPELVLLQLPEVFEIQAHVEADRPVIVFPLNRISEWLTLRMTLDADVVGLNVI